MSAKSHNDYGRSNSCNLSLYDYHVKVIKDYKEKADFKKDAQALQSIIEYFDKTKGKNIIKNLLLFVAYPMLFFAILNRIADTLFNLNNDMINAGLKFEALYRFANTVNMFGFAVSAFGITSVMLFIYMIKKRGF